MSRRENISYVINILKGNKPSCEPDWYDALGFMFSHRIAGLFYGKAKELGVALPRKIDFLLRDVFDKQIRSVICKREYIKIISETLRHSDAKYAFLKGSVLSNIPLAGKRIYSDGERVSNDIDILASPSNISSIEKILRDNGFVQGRYDRSAQALIEFPRAEILKCRMTRGEVAPFVKLTGNAEFPFIEIDINFSLGNTPNEGQDLLLAVLDSAKYCDGEININTPSEEMFFIHLIMHQYKESCLYFMVQRSKELDVYKLADIYYLLKNNVVDMSVLDSIIQQYGISSRVGAVLKQVGDVFEDDRIQLMAKDYGTEQPLVTDYENKKRYAWVTDIRKRLCEFSAIDFLEEVGNAD